MVASHRQEHTNLEGMITANKLLLTVYGKLVVGSAERYYIPPANPVRDLASKSFNVHTTCITTELKPELEEEVQPKLHFVFKERFWFNEELSQEFYRSILADIVVKDANGVFLKAIKPTVFLLSPKYLLSRVTEECQEVLMRGYIYDGRPIDEELIKELHRNAAEYLINPQKTAETSNHDVEQSTKPMIYYQVSINAQGLETLAPYLYIPRTMIKEVRNRRGSLVKTNLLVTIPENLNPEELLAQTKLLSNILYEALWDFFNQNPDKTKYFHNKAMELKNQGTISTSSLAVVGDIEAKNILSVLEEEILVQSDINGEKILLASILADINIQSKVASTYHSSAENFDKAILVQAKIHADNSLHMFAKNKVQCKGSYNNVELNHCIDNIDKTSPKF